MGGGLAGREPAECRIDDGDLWGAEVADGGDGFLDGFSCGSATAMVRPGRRFRNWLRRRVRSSSSSDAARTTPPPVSPVNSHGCESASG